MIAALRQLQNGQVRPFEFDVIDIDLHPALDETWGDKVPVLLIGQTEICHYFLDADRLAHHLSGGM